MDDGSRHPPHDRGRLVLDDDGATGLDDACGTPGSVGAHAREDHREHAAAVHLGDHDGGGGRLGGGCRDAGDGDGGHRWEGEEAWTPTAIRARREKRERQDVDELIQFGLSRSERNKDYGARGFEDMVKAYNPGLYERSKDSDLLKAVVKALETGRITPDLGREIGDKVAQAIKENPPVTVQPDADHPVKVVRGQKGQARPKWESLFNGRGRHGG